MGRYVDAMKQQMLAEIDRRRSELEPVLSQLLGSKEQRLAQIESAYLQHWREKISRPRTVKKLRPSK